MTDRLFAACCYGSDDQHREDEPCPWAFLDRGDPPQTERERVAWELELYFNEPERKRGIQFSAADRVIRAINEVRGAA